MPGTSSRLKKSMNSVLGPAANRLALRNRLTRSSPGCPVDEAPIGFRGKYFLTNVRVGWSVAIARWSTAGWRPETLRAVCTLPGGTTILS